MQVSVFISYCHHDESWLKRLRIHLKPLERQTSIQVFSDTDIISDENWRSRIHSEIEKAKVAILLVSPDFIASDFVSNHELPKLFQGRASGQKKLFTIFLSPCAIELVPEIANFQGFNDPSKPLNELPESQADRIFANLVGEIAKAFEINAEKVTVDKSSSRYWGALPEIDYGLARAKRVFSGVRVSLPRLVSKLDTGTLDGFSFEDSWIVGPSVIWAPFCNLSHCNLDRAGEDSLSLFMTPRSEHWTLGVVSMSHLSLHRCRLTDISFLDPRGDIEKSVANLLVANTGNDYTQ